MQMRFTFRPTASIILSYSITGSITNCHNYILGVKLEMGVCNLKHYAPNCMFVLKLANCRVCLFHLNEVKFNFL